MKTEKRWATGSELRRMGKEWAWLAIRHNCEPTTTGNVEHDRACAEEYLRQKGQPPMWYTEGRFGAIYYPFGTFPQKYTHTS